MRSENNETKAKIETEREIKKLLWDRDQKLRERDQYDRYNCT